MADGGGQQGRLKGCSVIHHPPSIIRHPAMTINDAHCHFFSSKFLELLVPDGGGADATAQRLGWDRPGTAGELADRWAKELETNGVSRAVLIASVPGDEESVAQAVARHPSRFVGFFMFNPLA